MGHVCAPKYGYHIDKGYLKVTRNEHEVDEGNERPETPCYEKCWKEFRSNFFNRVLEWLTFKIGKWEIEQCHSECSKEKLSKKGLLQGRFPTVTSSYSWQEIVIKDVL